MSRQSRIHAPAAALALAGAPLAAQTTDGAAAAVPPATAAEDETVDETDDGRKTDPTAKPASDKGYEEVIVTAEARDRRLIDRRNYVIKDSPAAETKTATEVLRDLPSVSVDGAGRLRLLNNGNVRILIDGRTVPDPQGFLRNLTGNEIARVEVVTNPSAAFASEGTAGVINVILRKTYRPGIAGTASGSVDTLGGMSASLSPSYTDGPWTVSTSPRLYRGRFRNEGTFEQIALNPLAAGIANRVEDSDTRGEQSFFANRTQVGYKLNERRSVTGSLSFASGRNDSRQRIDVAARGGEFLPFRRQSDSDGYYDNISGALEYRANGKKPGQSLTASTTVSWSRFGSATDTADLRGTGGAGRLFNSYAADTATVESKIDYTVPRGKSDRLSIGASFEGEQERIDESNRGAPLIGPPRDLTNDYGGGYAEAAAYATYQTGIGKLKVLPGLRVQSRTYRLDGPGSNGPDRIDLFPSLHVEHPLLKKVDLNLSYSRRAAWPQVGQLVPLLRLNGGTNALAGNPALDPAFTDALEAKIEYAGPVHNGTLTLFNRTTHAIVEGNSVLLPNGVVLASFFNAGDRIERGAEAAAQGRVAPRLRYSVSGNIAAVERQVIGAGRATDSQYGGKAQLSYAEPRAAAPGYDQVEGIVEYVGPNRSFQTDTKGFFTTNLTWTHRFTPRLSSVLNAQNVLGAPRFASTARLPNLLIRSRSIQPAPVVRLALTRSLGKPPAAAAAKRPAA